jgi:hypothetical protein
MAQVTAADIRALLTSTGMDPMLVAWLDEDEAVTDMIEVVSGSLGYTTRDGTFLEGDRAGEVLATANDLRQVGDWDIDNPTDEDCEAFAAQINEDRR